MLRRYFTLEEANGLIPRLQPIIERILQLHMLLMAELRSLHAKGHVVEAADLAQAPEPGGDSEPHLAHARAMYASILVEMRMLESLGAELKGIEQGLVDLWSYLDGETEVLLCWKVGEKQIQFFHYPEAGFAGRTPVRGHLFMAQRAATRVL